MRDRVEDALNATKLAITLGGERERKYRWSHFYKSPKLFQQPPNSSSVRAGIEIFKKALQAPARQIITNAGLDKILIVNKLLQSTESHFDGKFTLWITDLVKVTK
ncbi:MAG: hypothetical protein ACTS6G_06220 [Candidatus Hodgkinia cicadicola]